VTPLVAKGKSDPLSDRRLPEVAADAPGFARRVGTPMVGRGRQLKLLGDAYENVVSERSCHLFTVLASRSAAEHETS